MVLRLEAEQIDLLTELVEKHRSVPRESRDKFHVLNSTGGTQVIHPRAGGNWQLRAVQSDLRILASYGLIEPSYGQGGLISGLAVRPEGIAFYEQMKREAGEPVAQVEAEVRRYLDAEGFAGRHPTAFAKWRQAEDRLWSSDAPASLTAIGHHCREALQAFATELVERYEPPNVDSNPQHDVARVRAVLDLARRRLGDTEAAFLDALLAYWGTVTDLAQRQEHDSGREGAPLIWEDARRLVFLTATVIFEVSRSMRRVLG